MKTKKIRILALLLAMLVVLPACGTTAKPATEESTEANLVYWSMWNETEPQAQVILEATEKFMEEHEGVTIDIQWNGREIRKTLQPAIEAGTTIDIWDEDLERVIKNWGEYALNLDELSKTS